MIKLRSVFKGVVTGLLALFLLAPVHAQVAFDEQEFLQNLKRGGGLPTDLLSTKATVLHSFTFSESELLSAQQTFQRSGVDAVTYYPLDMVLAGRDVSKAFTDQFIKREIRNLVILEKNPGVFRISIVPFNGKETLVDSNQTAWSLEGNDFKQMLKVLSQTLSSGLKRTNLLINAVPESGSLANPIPGRRNDFYAVDMKVDLVAIPKFGNEVMDRELEQIIAANFPFKYKMTEPGIPDKELRKQGMLYVMCLVHTRARVAQELLGYNTGKAASAVVSVTYPEGLQQQLKNIPSNTPVYKIYFKHIDSGNVFLGNKWDADLTWQSALLNQIRGMKSELRLN